MWVGWVGGGERYVRGFREWGGPGGGRAGDGRERRGCLADPRFPIGSAGM